MQRITAILIRGYGYFISMIEFDLKRCLNVIAFNSIYKKICKKYSDYEVERGREQGAEYVSIMKSGFSKPIKIYYDPDIGEYIVTFAIQHIHIDEDIDLLDEVSNFANGSIAAIEFYENGKDIFGGQIETSSLEKLTYDTLRTRFGYPNLDISKMTFRVYAWNENYCFEGSFAKSAENTIQIFKKDSFI